MVKKKQSCLESETVKIPENYLYLANHVREGQPIRNFNDEQPKESMNREEMRNQFLNSQPIKTQQTKAPQPTIVEALPISCSSIRITWQAGVMFHVTT